MALLREPLRRALRAPLGSVLGPNGLPIEDAGGSVMWTPTFVATANRGWWGTGATMAGAGTVTAWNDVWGGSAFAQSGTPARNTADAAYVGGISAGFVEASSQFFTGPGAASAYKAIHDGTGATVFASFLCTDSTDDTQILWATQNSTATAIGTLLRYRASSQGFQLSNGNGTSLDSVTINSVAAPNVVHTVVYDRIGTAYRLFCDGALVSSGNWPSTSSADPLGVLRLGVRSVTATEFFEGTMGEAGWFKEAKAAEAAAYLETRVV